MQSCIVNFFVFSNSDSGLSSETPTMVGEVSLAFGLGPFLLLSLGNAPHLPLHFISRQSMANCSFYYNN